MHYLTLTKLLFCKKMLLNFITGYNIELFYDEILDNSFPNNYFKRIKEEKIEEMKKLEKLKTEHEKKQKEEYENK